MAAYQPFSKQVETLRAIRSQLMMQWFAAGHKALALVSANPEESSMFAANLAVVFSRLGERTVLVGGNLRSPRQHELFRLGRRQEPKPGRWRSLRRVLYTTRREPQLERQMSILKGHELVDARAYRVCMTGIVQKMNQLDKYWNEQ